MSVAQRKLLSSKTEGLSTSHHSVASPRRAEVEGFIRQIFAAHYGATVPSFAPELFALEQGERITAAAGWRGAQQGAVAERLYLENYLDIPIEQAVSQIAQREVAREKIVEVGNLAAVKAGSSIAFIVRMARHFERLGYEWVVFTATEELIRIFGRVGLPLIALAPADPERVGNDAANWGRYYDTQPIVVTERIRIASERIGKTL